MGKFANQIDRFARKYERRYRAIARTSVQDTIAMAQRTRGEGGRMRVDTGFLRASIQAGLYNLPQGPAQPRKGAVKGEYIGQQVAGEPVAVTLLKWDPNIEVPLFVGWTANYARHREAKDGFLRGSVELWDQTVRKAAKKVEAGFG